MSDPGASLTGAWSGVYSYPGTIKPTSFTAELVEAGGRLRGSTEEVRTEPPGVGQLLTATLDGEREAAAVSFIKTYDAMDGDYDLVIYEGALNGDATEIEGRWRIPGVWSGSFLMIRQAPPAEAVEAEAEAEEEVPAYVWRREPGDGDLG